MNGIFRNAAATGLTTTPSHTHTHTPKVPPQIYICVCIRRRQRQFPVAAYTSFRATVKDGPRSPSAKATLSIVCACAPNAFPSPKHRKHVEGWVEPEKDGAREREREIGDCAAVTSLLSNVITNK